MPIFRLWSLAIIAAALPVEGVLRVYARTRFLFGLNLARLVLVAALIQPFLSAFGLTGAVLVSLIATFSGKAFGLFGSVRGMRIPLREMLPWAGLATILTTSLAAAVPAVLLHSMVSMPPPAMLAASSLLYAVSLFGLFVAVGLVNRTAVDPLSGWARAALAREAGTNGPRTT